ncbi:mitochondrial 18 KDa protein-domain-containing protein [Zopfochytrium polystomum]|nr:mitochondrial 18 KDa protein-domain-containing protein [Zopfochytrium polystomum]
MPSTTTTTTTTTATTSPPPPTPDNSSSSNKDGDGDIDTIETPARYLGVLGRIRAVAAAQTRLLAYSSEVGEAFRPVFSPTFVTGAYTVSWLYVIGDVGYEGYKMNQHGAPTVDTARTVVERGVFQSLASPSTRSSTSPPATSNPARPPPKSPSSPPTGLGLAVIPLLPTLFDEPTEWATEKLFDAVWPYTDKGRGIRDRMHAHLHKDKHEKKE